MLRIVTTAAIALMPAVGGGEAAEKSGLKTGTPNLKSVGPITFGPGGILFVSDPLQASVFAIDMQDAAGDATKVRQNVEGINEQIAGLLGTTARNVIINDLAVNPISGSVYFSVSRGRGPSSTPVIARLDPSSKLSVVSLKEVKFARAQLPNPPADRTVNRRGRTYNQRSLSITDLAYTDGKLIVAGLSNEEFASNLRTVPFPFKETDRGSSVEIFHGAHGRYETRSPVRTLLPVQVAGKTQVLAAYTCTPLVRFPLSDLKPGKKVRGTTVAELGNRNNPLDIISYEKDGKQFLLMANDRRGVMKITTQGIDTTESITKRISGTAGLTYDTISKLQGVVQLDKLNRTQAVVLVRGEQGALNLQTVPLP